MHMRGSGAAALAACAVAIAMTAALACASDGDARPTHTQATRVADDTAAVGQILSAVRGANPVLCELATRHVDMHGRWSHWGPMGGNPLEGDSAAAALLDWIQGDHKDPAVVPTLRTAMRDQDACVRRVAGSLLGRIDAAAATAALLDALDDSRADTRYVAVLGLGLSDKPATVAPLTRRLRDDSPAVRRAAAWSLGALGGEARSALDELIRALERDADPRVRQAAAWALGEIDG